VFRNRELALIALTLLTLHACKKGHAGAVDGGDTSVDAGDAGMDMSDGSTADVGEEPFPESGKATLRFKRSERLRNDFAQALALDPAKLCLELGQYSCTDLVHTIALGGVEPYILGIREPLASTTITTPMAVERVAFAGCVQRVSQDLMKPDSAVIFKGLTIDSNGAIPNIDAPEVASIIDTLYQRILLRPARPSEADHLKQLYNGVLATNEPQPARDWAMLACFSVLTTMESLFY
jgi:hypothetical protein